jgi:uncharacterized protein
MYKIPLTDVPEGGREFSFRIPRETPLVEIPLGEFSKDLSIRGNLVRRDKDFFIIHLEAKALARVPCRRCLATCEISLELGRMIYVKREPHPREEEDSDDEYLVIGLDEKEVDIEGALRELILLDFPVYPLCNADCRGLCPQCGQNLNERVCGCSAEKIDPRWDALRELRERMTDQ